MQPHFIGENVISVERKYIDVPLSAITASTLPVSSRASQPVQEMGTRLLELAKKGDSEGVRELMSCGAPFSTDWLGTSPLHFAAQHNHLETVEMLLRAGISRDARNKVERTPLHVAAQEGHVQVCRLLINFGADVDCRDMLKMTPLHWGAEKGHSQVIRLLLDFGADPLVLNKFDKSPHDIAHDNSYLDIMEMLQDAASLDPISRKVLKNQGLVSSLENNLQSVPEQTQMTQQTVESIANLPDNSDEIQASNNETQNATSTLQMLQEHGITMLPVDDSSIVASAVQSGQTVVLTEAGKMALNLTKLNSSPAARNMNAGTNVGFVKKLPMTTKHVKTNNFPAQKILIDGRKLIRVQPEELINMTREKKVIIHTGDKRLGRPGQIIFSKPIRQITHSSKLLDVQNKKVTSSELRNVDNSVKTVVKSVEVKCEKNLKDFEEITKQLEEARREAEMYKEQLMLKEKEAEQYKLQLQSLVSGK